MSARAEDLWDGLDRVQRDLHLLQRGGRDVGRPRPRRTGRRLVDPGLALTVLDAGDGLFGFVHFPHRLASTAGARAHWRRGPGAEAVEGVLAELERSGRVIVAGDGFRLPWHVAHGRRHVPHWYVLSNAGGPLEAFDPFACRNDLGVQEATRSPIATRGASRSCSSASPAKIPSSSCASASRWATTAARRADSCQWFVHGEVTDSRAPDGVEGAAGVLMLARHFREHGQDQSAYSQVDDIWSIARHRAFLARHATARAARTGDETLAAWVSEHGEPLAKRWGHMAPLLMQATLALGVGTPRFEQRA